VTKILGIIIALLTKPSVINLVLVLQVVTFCFFPVVLWRGLSNDEQVALSTTAQANMCGISVEEFNLMSAVTEAESDRSDNLEAKVFVAMTIWNRVNSDDWPDTVTGVITQSGQFQVYYEGTYKDVGSNSLSDQAVVEAYIRIQEGNAPNVIYFNCIGYNGLGTPYACIGGNYFSTVP